MPSVAHFAPPTVPLSSLDEALRDRGYAVLDAPGVAALAGVGPEALQALVPSWEDLRRDGYLKDGGRYRRRRHACFVVEGEALRQVPHRMHWQSLDYNALHGGMERWFEPVEPAVVAQPVWSKLLLSLAQVFSARMPVPRWFVEAHQFRIEAAAGVPGFPTPEGVHHDGVDCVLITMIARTNLEGGETVIEDDDGNRLAQFVLRDALDTAVLDDPRVRHGVTPVAPADPALPSCRDVLVLTWKRGGVPGQGG